MCNAIKCNVQDCSELCAVQKLQVCRCLQIMQTSLAGAWDQLLLDMVQRVVDASPYRMRLCGEHNGDPVAVI
jgi:hypothetical protein